MQKALTCLLLLAVGVANAQNTTGSTSYTPSTPPNPSPITTDSTRVINSTSNTVTPSSPTSGNQTYSTAPQGSFNTGTSVNSAPATNSYGTTTTTTTDTYSTTTDTRMRDKRAKDYKNFVFGIYAGLNSTRFSGEDVDGDNLRGRLGYQAGFFVRGGGRLYGQLGAEYFASSSNFYRPGDGSSVSEIEDNINIQYVQIPVYIGYKLVESDRGISAVRLQVGAEYANRINSNSGDFNLSNSEIKSGTFNALGQLGFDIGPLLIDLTYHHGLSDALEGTGFPGSQRRIVSASVGFKF
ncbi:PorT family protein [Fibrisoma montanum]|uniref:PorT family protein n=1 Tax=Fibrisoma montanum TaxID=2305895 RepID=A0A418MFJ3_9BACT|nr:outer membrane beta-barrel protein [Fibrisoma montanum]RIV25535.1 PorT family protein [Fibrisoma montanum]